MTTPRLGAPELATSQANKEETVNEQIRYIESGAGHFIFKDRDLSTPPGSPADGDCYLVKATGLGAWAGHDGDIAFYLNTAWVFINAVEGFTAWVNDEDLLIGFDGAAWNSLASPSGVYIPLTYLDTDVALAANSDAKIASQKATKAYVDGKIDGKSWKQAVRAATAVAGTLATSFENGDAIDGVTLATGDRILIKNQAAGAENGIYIVAASGAPARSTDADSGAELVNATTYVSEGTANADTQWTCTTNATITVGSTSLTFAQSGGSGYTPGGTDVAVADGGTGASTAAAARTNLGAAAHDPAIQSVTSSATVTPTFSDDQVNITAQAAALALANPTGTAVPAWGIAIRIKDNGTARAISYDTQYRAIGVTLPTTTVISKTLYLGMIYNSTDTKWDVVAVAQEA